MVRTAAPTPQRAPRQPPAPEPRHLRVVERGGLSAAQRRRRTRVMFIAGLGTATLVCFALVYLHVLLAQRQFRIDHLNSQVQKEQAAYQQLRLQVAGLGSPAHIVSTAEGQLGMHQPSKVTYLTPSQSVPAQPAVSQLPDGQASSPGPSSNQAAGAGASGGGVSNSAGTTNATTPAPAGDADWPTIKSQLAGVP